MSELWVICLDCDFKRHGSNSELLKHLHEENCSKHRAKVVLGSAESPYMPHQLQDNRGVNEK